MNQLDLVYHPDARLRRAARTLMYVGAHERRLLDRMLANMRRWNGTGLAAPQVGVGVRAITMEYDGSPLELVNPSVIDRSGSERMNEGCLSVPGREVEVTRPRSVWIQGLDTENKTIQLKLDGLPARVILHEIDHLNGILIIDYAPALHR